MYLLHCTVNVVHFSYIYVVCIPLGYSFGVYVPLCLHIMVTVATRIATQANLTVIYIHRQQSTAIKRDSIKAVACPVLTIHAVAQECDYQWSLTFLPAAIKD